MTSAIKIEEGNELAEAKATTGNVLIRSYLFWEPLKLRFRGLLPALRATLLLEEGLIIAMRVFLMAVEDCRKAIFSTACSPVTTTILKNGVTKGAPKSLKFGSGSAPIFFLQSKKSCAILTA